MISEITLPDLPLYASKRRRICCFGYWIGLRKNKLATTRHLRSEPVNERYSDVTPTIRLAARQGPCFIDLILPCS